MARKKHNPGCPCCESCLDETFTNNYSSFHISDGEFVPADGLSPGYWSLPEGSVLDSGERQLGESWFQTIEFRGGALSPGERFDLEWDGLSFEIRDLDGTITDGTHSSVFVPKAEHPNAIIHYAVTLWVTPLWYAVMIAPSSVNRGSVQVIDRNNSSASKSVRITSVTGNVNISQWRISDSTVFVSGTYPNGEIARQCPKPGLGFCTERLYQSQIDLSESLSIATSVDRYNYTSLNGECFYVDTVEDSLLLLDVITDNPTEYSESICGLGGYLSFDPGFGFDPINPRIDITATGQVALPASEAVEPYPKPVVRYSAQIEWFVSHNDDFLLTCEPYGIEIATADVVLIADGTAAVQFNLESLEIDDFYFSCHSLETCAEGKSPGMALTNITVSVAIEWVAE